MLVSDCLQAGEDCGEVGAAVLRRDLDVEDLGGRCDAAELLIVTGDQTGHERAVAQAVTGGPTTDVHPFGHVNVRGRIHPGVHHRNSHAGSGIGCRRPDRLAEGVLFVTAGHRGRNRVEAHGQIRDDEGAMGGSDRLWEVHHQGLGDLEGLHDTTAGRVDGTRDIEGVTGGAEQHSVHGWRCRSGRNPESHGYRHHSSDGQRNESSRDHVSGICLGHGPPPFGFPV